VTLPGTVHTSIYPAHPLLCAAHCDYTHIGWQLVPILAHNQLQSGDKEEQTREGSFQAQRRVHRKNCRGRGREKCEQCTGVAASGWRRKGRHRSGQADACAGCVPPNTRSRTEVCGFHH
jgi:hypothetical protein